jgi:ATP-dependent RNA helicase DDX49/DBP8
VSLVAEGDIGLLHGAERASGRQLDKCQEVTDDMALKLLGPAAKAARLAKMKLLDAGFDELAQRFKERKARDRADRERVGRALRRMEEGRREA